MDKNNARAKQHPSYGAFTVIGLLLPLIGIIVGIIYLAKKDLLDRKVGEHTIVMSIIGIALGVVLVAVLSSSSPNKSSTTSSTSTTDSTATTKEAEKPKGKVEVKSDALKTQYGYKRIVGEVVNNTTGDATFIKITATYYDKDGKVTGTESTYAGDASTPLAPTLTAPFDVASLDTSLVVDHYKLDVTWQ